MLLSCSLILILGYIFGEVFKKMKLPSLVGMLLTGIVLGPYILNLLDSNILMISTDLRKIALVIILTRAGLNLKLEDLKKVGRPAILMSFLPACFEIVGTVFLSTIFFDLNLKEALLLGSVLAAVSPAVVVPKMVKLIDENKGCDKSIPQLILAGASIDDVFVIALFTSFTSFIEQDSFSFVSLMDVPLSIGFGILVGIGFGFILNKISELFKLDEITQLLVLFGLSLLIVSVETLIPIPYASLISVMCMAMTLSALEPQSSKKLSLQYSKLWKFGEIFLFVLVGASVNLDYALNLGFSPIIFICLVLLFRMVGVILCLLKTNLNRKERLFCVIAYLPKATVQAAIGGLPLSYGFGCGDIILTIAVVSILFTAPLGAFLIDNTYQNFLN